MKKAWENRKTAFVKCSEMCANHNNESSMMSLHQLFLWPSLSLSSILGICRGVDGASIERRINTMPCIALSYVCIRGILCCKRNAIQGAKER